MSGLSIPMPKAIVATMTCNSSLINSLERNEKKGLVGVTTYKHHAVLMFIQERETESIKNSIDDT